ncbi:hypothetical protein HYS95_02170 [Candidatus Daviesbacteria bacterium]|nr:hypothetical protein [Candidatus Daviesbacteria bacterium]
MKKFFVFISTFYILLSTFYFTPAFAQTSVIGQSRINPSSPFYFLKAVRETVELKFADTSQERGVLQLEFAGRRMREVNSLVSTNRQDLIEPALIRYFGHLEKVKGLVNLKDKAIAKQIIDEVSMHMSVMENIYPQVSNPRARMSIKSTVFRLTRWDQELAERLILLNSPFVDQVRISKLSGCNFLSREASSSALNAVEKGVLSDRANECFGSN